MEAADHKALLRVSRACSQTDLEKNGSGARWKKLGEQGSLPGQTDKRGGAYRFPRAPAPEAARPAHTDADALARNPPSPGPARVEAPPPSAGLGAVPPPGISNLSSASGGGAARLRGTDTLGKHTGGKRCGTSGRMAEASERLYRVEYAKSGRASCKKCSESIPKDSLRMAIMVQVRRGRAGGAGRRSRGGCLGSGPPRSPCGSR